jgi:hypothetical protein
MGEDWNDILGIAGGCILPCCVYEYFLISTSTKLWGIRERLYKVYFTDSSVQRPSTLCVGRTSADLGLVESSGSSSVGVGGR